MEEEKSKKWYNGFSLTLAGEIVFFFFKIGDAMLEPSVRLFVYDKACEMVIYPNVTRCDHKAEISNDLAIQQVASQYLTAYKALLNAPAILLGCFCGAWSDRVGRKLPILVSCTGTILAILIYLTSMIAESPRTTLMLTLIGAGIRGAFGRSAVVTMALHSYVTDLTTNEARTRVLGRLLGMNYFGYFVGSILGGGLLDVVDFDIVFCVAIFMIGVCVFVCAIFMKDGTQHYMASDTPTPTEGAVEEDKTILGKQELIKPSSVPFHPKHVKESFTVFVKPRDDNLRCHIIILFVTLLVQQMCKSGETDFTLLYVEGQPFYWSEGMYGFFLAADYALLGIITAVILPIILRCCRPADINLILVGIFFKVIRLFVMLFSVNTWQIYLSIVLGCPSALVIAGAKSMLSKAIGDDEIGKTFSLLSCGETVANLVGSVLLTSIYGATAAEFKGSVFIVDMGINLILIIVVLFVSWDMRIMSRYALLRTVKGLVGRPSEESLAGAGGGYGTIDKVNSSHRKGKFVPTPSPSAFELSTSDEDETSTTTTTLEGTLALPGGEPKVKDAGAGAGGEEVKVTVNEEENDDGLNDITLVVPSMAKNSK